jgi:ParB family transcriptional regulator, chromosome partitioning protein
MIARAPKTAKATGGFRYSRSPRSFPLTGGLGEDESVRAIANAEARPLRPAELGVSYRRYRLADPAAETAMAESLRRYGQLAPVTACCREGRAELLDGFKRHAAAAQMAWPTLSVRLVHVDERSAKAAIFGLNSTGQHPSELEEAWIVQALVREDGLSQVEAAQLLNKHKSWVCRRLALLERLGRDAQAELRLGLLSPGLARQLTRLPVGNQAAVLSAARRDSLTVLEVQGVVDLLRGASPEQEAFVLNDPRSALRQQDGVPVRDPRLSPTGNRLARQLNLVIDVLGRIESWQRHPGLAELKRDDRRLLAPSFTRLARDSRRVANLVDEVWTSSASGDAG